MTGRFCMATVIVAGEACGGRIRRIILRREGDSIRLNLLRLLVTAEARKVHLCRVQGACRLQWIRLPTSLRLRNEREGIEMGSSGSLRLPGGATGQRPSPSRVVPTTTIYAKKVSCHRRLHPRILLLVAGADEAAIP